MFILLLLSSALSAFCMYKGTQLAYIDLFLLRDALYILELKALAGALPSPGELASARTKVQQAQRKKNLYYAASFTALAVCLFFFLKMIVRRCAL